MPGIVTSTMSMSLENLFKIRPKGVVSKNDIGERRMRESMVACNLVAAFNVPTEIRTVPTMMKVACNRPNTP